MRAFVILLLLCAIVSASLFDNSKLKEKFKALKGKITDKVKTALDKLKEKFDTTALADFREKLAGLKDKIGAKLTLTKEKLAEVAKRLKLVKRTKVDKVQPGGDNIDEINLNAGVGEAFYQGDIALTREQADEIVEGITDDGRPKRQAFRDKRYPKTIWPNRKVPYFFDESASQTVRSVFGKAAKLWAKDTCLDIYQDNAAAESIRVFKEEGCWSYVGKTRGKQNLSLGHGCESIGTAAHELGHALGFFHTHSRHDRNNYIDVLKNNIKEDWWDQFTLESKETNDNYDLPYDYGSLMQYGATSASKDKQKKLLSMIPLDNEYTETLGSPFISFIDLLMMNRHYNCTGNCPTATSAKCENDGFPHPRNCSECICPGGYGGPLCKDRPEGCGEILNATEFPVEWTGVIGNKSAGVNPREDFDMCYYWITAPVGKKVVVELMSFKPQGIAVDGCTYGGVEFKWHWDRRRTGSRYCSTEDANTKLISTSNIMPVIMYNRIYESTIKIKYYYI
ncbi:hypothetical protein Q1695_001848 [Nippostrongylus brasiliensis]|nr:hypothetical protein Q1695_001848 [Nippostrongylus brasiliensis]